MGYFNIFSIKNTISQLILIRLKKRVLKATELIRIFGVSITTDRLITVANEICTVTLKVLDLQYNYVVDI